MTQPAQEPSTSREFVKQSSLYQEFLAEREEILKHKWIESERLGYDVGFERALLDWIRKHRESWRSARRQSQHAHSTAPVNSETPFPCGVVRLNASK
ncbi:MAG: hypothetical protein RL077_1965 [Verrucomicrobiota bacterium]|jgi:hypothetical protein